MSETGKRIKLRRKELGMSADELAEILGVSRSTIFRYERGDIEKVPADLINVLSKALRTTPAYLMGWEDNATEENAELLVDVISDKRLLEKIKKFNTLNAEHQQTVSDMIDYLHKKEGH